MQSKKAACILARGGSNLWVKQCSLACDAGGLPHLYSAIVTARPARPCKSSWQRPTMPSALKAGRGSVVVSETYVQVRFCSTTQSLRIAICERYAKLTLNVRALRASHDLDV